MGSKETEIQNWKNILYSSREWGNELLEMFIEYTTWPYLLRRVEDVRTVRGVTYEIFRDACFDLGLLDDDKEYINGIVEASSWASGQFLRKLFVTLLASDSLSLPEMVWEKCWLYLSEDIFYYRRRILHLPELQMSDDEIKGFALVDIEKLLRRSGRSLHEFQCMPYPDREFFCVEGNSLINDEGYGGTGKTFVWKTLSAALRSKGEIVLNVASSGIASLLLPGGRTTHSRFKIPISVNEDTTCHINQGSQLAELIVKCKLIIWDEAPMIHKHCFEAVDRSLREIMRSIDPLNEDKPFGGKTIVFGGDFRQILPIIPKGRRQDIVLSSINSSYLWKDCRVLRLTKNMRLQQIGSSHEATELKEFSDWIASIGDGTIGGPNDGHVNIDIPDDILIKSYTDPIAMIVSSTYPSFSRDISDTSYLQERAILAPTLEIVDSVNQYMTSLNETEGKSYRSSDSTCQADSESDLFQQLHTSEFLNTIRCSGVPNHEIVLKIGTLVMLLRNMDHSNGLCNGSRLMITTLGDHILEAKVLQELMMNKRY